MMSLPPHRDHVGSLQSLRALLDVKLDALAFFQVSEATALDCGKVDEDVSASLTLDESIAFGPIEPLDGSSYSFRHFAPFKDFVRKKVQPVVACTKRPDL
jgi:hypothetical protein